MSQIRRLDAADAEELGSLLRICWLNTYTGILPRSVIQTAIEVWHSRENLVRGLQNPLMYYAGYVEDVSLVGIVAAAKTSDDTLKVYQLYVHPSRQREGIGSKLMDSAILHFDGVRRVVLEVEEGNQKGTNFYKKSGFAYLSRSTVKVGNEEIPCLVGELSLPSRPPIHP